MDDASDFEVIEDDFDYPPELVDWLASSSRDEFDEDDARRDLRIDVMQAYQKEWARSEARRLDRERRLAAEVSRIGEVTSFKQKLATDVEPLSWMVDGLHAHGDSTMLVATNKAGKTTLALNLVAALLDGEPFLGEWPTKFGEGTILYLNYEVSERRFREWAAALGVTHTERLIDVHLRGKHFPVDHPGVQAQVAEVAREHDASLIVIDPFQRAYRGESENDSTQVNRFLGALDELKERAGVPNLLVLDHAGHTEKGRARGSSAKGGWPDSTWSLTKDPEGPRRHLSAEGRDVSLGKRPLTFDPHTHRLAVAEGPAGTGASAPELTLADHGLLAVTRSMGEGDEVRGATAVRKGFRGLSGGKRDDALREAIALGWVAMRRDGQAHAYAVTESGRERVDALGEGVIDDG